MSAIPEAQQSKTPAPARPKLDTAYVGLATRGIAFALDAALLNLVAILVGLGVSLILSLFHLPKDLRTVFAAVGGVTYVIWSVCYFVTFWSTTGQTPGNRVMQIRVVGAKGRPLRVRRALVRCIGVVLAVLPLFAGYLPILFDTKRRGFHDLLAGTVVVEAPQLSIAATRHAQKSAAGLGTSGRPPRIASQ